MKKRIVLMFISTMVVLLYASNIAEARPYGRGRGYRSYRYAPPPRPVYYGPRVAIRVAPPPPVMYRRVWVPGYWRTGYRGRVWIPGYWVRTRC